MRNLLCKGSVREKWKGSYAYGENNHFWSLLIFSKQKKISLFSRQENFHVFKTEKNFHVFKTDNAISSPMLIWQRVLLWMSNEHVTFKRVPLNQVDIYFGDFYIELLKLLELLELLELLGLLELLELLDFL